MDILVYTITRFAHDERFKDITKYRSLIMRINIYIRRVKMIKIKEFNKLKIRIEYYLIKLHCNFLNLIDNNFQ